MVFPWHTMLLWGNVCRILCLRFGGLFAGVNLCGQVGYPMSVGDRFFGLCLLLVKLPCGICLALVVRVVQMVI